MIGNRHIQTAHSGRRSLVLLSLLALLSLMCFPMLAQAEDSSGLVYENGPPNAEGNHTEHQPIAKSSNGNPPSGGTPSAPAETESPVPSEVNSGAVPSEESGATGPANRPEGHQGSPGKGKTNAQKKDAPSPATSAPKVSSDGGGSSSHLVPILIALAALAAISVGVVVVRQRKGGRSDSGLPTRAG